MDQTVENKLADLRNRIRRLDSALVAYSGGVDSTLLLRICREELGEKAVAVTARSEKYPASELSLARRIAKILGVRHITRNFPLGASRPAAASVYSSLKSLAARLRVKAVLDGSHKDDESERGASFIAAKKAGVRSPLLESGLSKAEIRLLAKEFGLPNWDKSPSSSSGKRKAGNLQVLQKLESAKRYLARLGMGSAMVGMCGGKLCITVKKKDLVRLSRHVESLTSRIRLLGFTDVVLRHTR